MVRKYIAQAMLAFLIDDTTAATVSNAMPIADTKP
jgi:hypothetical protein